MKIIKIIVVLLCAAIALSAFGILFKRAKDSSKEDTSETSEIVDTTPQALTISGIYKLDMIKEISGDIDAAVGEISENISFVYGFDTYDHFEYLPQNLSFYSNYESEAQTFCTPYEYGWQAEHAYIDFGVTPQVVSQEFLDLIEATTILYPVSDSNFVFNEV